MSGVSRKPDKDRSLDFKGFLKDFKDWDSLSQGKDQKLKGQAADGKKQGSSRSAGIMNENQLKNGTAGDSKKEGIKNSRATSGDHEKRYMQYTDAISELPNSFLNHENQPNATSEKDLGNEYFKQKKYLEAIECYSRSIAFSPTSVAFANRAMAYIKIKRFEEAEQDCTEALDLDDRYVKAYSRRATARKELGKFKASMEDSEFAMRLEPNNPELRKQYTEAKLLLEKEITKKNSALPKNPSQGIKRIDDSVGVTKDVQHSNGKVSSEPVIVAKGIDSRGMKGSHSHGSEALSSTDNKGISQRKRVPDVSVQDLASRAASRVMASAVTSISAPKSAYEFEVLWRALSADSEKQAQLLKKIVPTTLPGIFKNALSAPMLIEIIKCTAAIFKEDTEFAVNILDNLAKVPRFDMIVMCLSAVDHAEICRLWEQVFSSKDIRAEQLEKLNQLRPKYCYGEFQASVVGSAVLPR